MAITLNDVAQRAGVSRSAVSRTFTDGASVSKVMRQKVEDAAIELGYTPNFLARSLTTRSTKLIGLVSDNFHNPIFLEVFDQFTRGLQDRGLRPLLVNLSETYQASSSLRMLQQYSVDGVIVASSTLPPEVSEAFRSAGIRVVNSFGRFSLAPKVDVVGIDDEACGQIAAETLLARGYKRLAFLGGPQAATSTQSRLRGFLSELQRAGGPTPDITFAEAYSFEAGRAEMQRLLRETTPAEAYFCGDDVLSIGALSAIRDHGLRVPEDIGLIGVNDMQMSGWQNINLTTIAQPFAEIIQTSIDVIVDMLHAPKQPAQARRLPCRLVERGTLRARP